jgi:hypothetical protein
MNKMPKVAIVILMTLLVHGCGHQNSIIESKTRQDTRTFAGPCRSALVQERSGPLAALGDAILPTLIDKSLSLFSTAIRKAGEASTVSITASYNTEIGSDVMPVKCITIVQGNFYTQDTYFHEGTYAALNPLGDQNQSDIKLSYSHLKTMGAYLAGAPAFFFEGALNRSEDRAAIAIQPTIILYNSLLGSKTLNWFGGTRDLVVSTAISAPGSAGANEQGTIGQFKLKGLSTGTMLLFDVKGPQTAWIPIQLTQQKAPRTIEVTITETKDANKFLTFLADVLDGSKEQVETVLKQTLVQSERTKLKQQLIDAEKARQLATTAATTDSIQAQTDARLAIIDYTTAKDAYDKAGSSKSDLVRKDLIEKGGAAIKSMIAANLKARQAGSTEPYDATQINGIETIIKTVIS